MAARLLRDLQAVPTHAEAAATPQASQKLLPVLGVFTVTDGKISKWSDYFDAGTFRPLMEAVRQS